MPFVKQRAISSPMHPGRRALDRLLKLYIHHFRERCARKAYDASCLALRDGALTGACYLQRDAAKLYAEAQAYTKLADEP
jgi:hypothetical protein